VGQEHRSRDAKGLPKSDGIDSSNAFFPSKDTILFQFLAFVPDTPGSHGHNDKGVSLRNDMDVPATGISVRRL